MIVNTGGGKGGITHLPHVNHELGLRKETRGVKTRQCGRGADLASGILPRCLTASQSLKRSQELEIYPVLCVDKLLIVEF